MIIPTKYQPIQFKQSGSVDCNTGACGPECEEAGNWNQMMFENDYVGFQFEITPCDNAPNLIGNPDFASNGAGWTAIGAFTSFSTLGARLYNPFDGVLQEGGLNVDQYYLVSITTKVEYEYGVPIQLSLLGTFEDVQFNSTFTAQTQSFYVRSTGGNIGVERITGTSENSSPVFIQYFTVKPIELPDISIIDTDGVFIENVTGATFEPPYLNVYYSPTEDVIAEGVFQIKVNYACDEEEVITYISEPIEIIANNDCFIQIGGCGNINVLGGGFTPFMRIESKLIADRQPKTERFLTRKTSGKFRLNYGRAAKAFTLTTAHVPEHVRDFLTLILPLCDKIVVKRGTSGQVSYFCDEEPDAPEFLASSDDLASIQLPLVYKEDLIESIFIQDCNVILPPAALGYRPSNLIIKAGTDTGINAE